MGSQQLRVACERSVRSRYMHLNHRPTLITICLPRLQRSCILVTQRVDQQCHQMLRGRFLVVSCPVYSEGSQLKDQLTVPKVIVLRVRSMCAENLIITHKLGLLYRYFGENRYVVRGCSQITPRSDQGDNIHIPRVFGRVKSPKNG